MKFQKNSAPQLAVVYEITSGKVTCSLVSFAGDSPRTVYTLQRRVCASRKPTYTELAYTLGSALASLTHDMSMRGYKKVKSESSAVAGVGILCGSPWSVDRCVRHRYRGDSNEIVNKRTKETLQRSYAPHKETGMLGEHEIMAHYVDGVLHSDEITEAGVETTTHLYTSMIVQPMARIVDTCIAQYWNTEEFIDVHTASWMVFQGVRSHIVDETYHIINLSEEVTTVIEVAHGVMVNTHVVPHGYYDMIRLIASETNMSVETVLTCLEMCQKGTCDGDVSQKNIDSMFRTAYNTWEHELIQCVPSIGSTHLYASASDVWSHKQRCVNEKTLIDITPVLVSQSEKGGTQSYADLLNRSYFS